MSTLARGVAFGDGANAATLRYTDDRSEDSFQVRGTQRHSHLAELVTTCSAPLCSFCLASHGSAGGASTIATDSVWFVLQTGSSTERRGRQTEGPTTWAEVDTEEIERVAVNIARNAMPSNAENTELASRLEAQVGRRIHQHQYPACKRHI